MAISMDETSFSWHLQGMDAVQDTVLAPGMTMVIRKGHMVLMTFPSRRESKVFTSGYNETWGGGG